MFVPKVWLFSVRLLVCEFKPCRQTWYQKFIGTYLLLRNTAHHLTNSRAEVYLAVAFNLFFCLKTSQFLGVGLLNYFIVFLIKAESSYFVPFQFGQRFQTSRFTGHGPGFPCKFSKAKFTQPIVFYRLCSHCTAQLSLHFVSQKRKI